MIRNHQPGQSVFRSILPEEIEWKPFPAFPPAARLAVMVGHPSEPGPYVVRVKVPGGTKLMPHKHPEDRIYTVMSGVFYIGLGKEFDGDKVKAYPPGSVIVLPGETWHFHWAKAGEYVTQAPQSARSALNIATARRSSPAEAIVTGDVHSCIMTEMACAMSNFGVSKLWFWFSAERKQ